MTIPPPRPVKNAVPYGIDIDGCLMPWVDSGLALLTIEGSDDLFLPLFSTIDKLQAVAELFKLTFDHVKRITDGVAFLERVPATGPDGRRVRIMLDPYREGDKTRFSEIMRDDKDQSKN